MTTAQEDSLKLEADGTVELFEIQLQPEGVLRFKNNNDVTYLGNLYEGIAIQITGVSQSATDEVARPRLTIANYQGVFSAAVDQGSVDNAIVIRRRVLYADLISDTNAYLEQSWRVAQVVTLNKNTIILQLRGQMDGQFFLFPPRMFIPPEFSQVSLQ